MSRYVEGGIVADPKPRRPAKTHCKHGHELVDPYVHKDGRRECRVCMTSRKAAWKKANPEKAWKFVYVPMDPYTVACERCGKERTVKIKNPSKLCRSCAATKTAVDLVCPCCSKTFKRKATYKIRVKGDICCSRECRAKHGYEQQAQKFSEERKGSGNPAYKHGRRSGTNPSRWRLARKGESCCRNCGSRDNVQLHHAIPRSTCSALKEELLNGLPLCRACHFGWHWHKTVIYRDVFTQEEWDFLSSADLIDRVTSAWLDDHYPDRGLPFREIAEAA